MKTYKSLMTLPSFEERFKYLKLDGRVGRQTFGVNRELNQKLYSSPEWKSLRRDIIVRDDACDLAVPGYVLPRRIYVHHIEPITVADILSHSSKVWDPDNLICVSFDTHQAIHYGDPNLLPSGLLVERKPNDTIPWKR